MEVPSAFAEVADRGIFIDMLHNFGISNYWFLHQLHTLMCSNALLRQLFHICYSGPYYAHVDAGIMYTSLVLTFVEHLFGR